MFLARLTAPLVTGAGRRGRRPLRSSIGKPSVGATLAVARPLHLLLRFRRGRCLHRPAVPTPCKKPCHCEPVTDVTGVAIRPPVPLAPLPKGGWHGEAVTGGFLPRTHGRAHGPCPTRCCVIGPGRTGSSAPTIASVGATLAVARGRAKPLPYAPQEPPVPLAKPHLQF